MFTESHHHYDRRRRSVSYPVGLRGKNATARGKHVHENKANVFLCDGIEMATFDPIFKKLAQMDPEELNTCKKRYSSRSGSPQLGSVVNPCAPTT